MQQRFLLFLRPATAVAAMVCLLGLSVWAQAAPTTAGQQQVAAATPPSAKPAAQPSAQPPAQAETPASSHKRLFIIGAVVAVAVVVAVVIANRKHTVCTAAGCTTTGGY
ncbi:MAG: hypothetical protein ACRD1L_09575 [Terriglobales bacterium]